MTLRSRLAVPTLSERIDLSAVDPRSTPGLVGGKGQAIAQLDALGVRLAALQERLYANGRTGDPRRIVLVLQAMDSGGKDGAVKHVIGRVNPAGVHVVSFGAPTPQELAHDFLWRVDKSLPPAGALGVFNRSHYEDVLIVRVHDLVPAAVWGQRYDQINAWEASHVDAGVVFVKVFLHISHAEQRKRLLARLDNPTKLWKVDPGDVNERPFWTDYQAAYEAVLERCSTELAPWYVLPADHKWYRNWALAHLLIETLEDLNQPWPLRPGLDLTGMARVLRSS